MSAPRSFDDGSDYYEVNPKGQVPTLRLDDGEFLYRGPGDLAVSR